MKAIQSSEGQKLRVEKLPNVESGEIVFDDVLMVSNGTILK